MTVPRNLLAAYLRQIADLGIGEVVLDDLTARDALRLLKGGEPARVTAAQGPREAAPTPAANLAAHMGALRAAAGDAHADARPAPAARPETQPAPRTPVTPTPSRAPTVLPALTELGAVAAGCRLCRLHESRTTVVFGEGDHAADVVVVGEAPGQEEDRSGRPFVGRAGKLLDLLLLTAGFPRESVYICNVLKCRPPGNRNPMADEVAACTTSYLHGQLESIGPKVVLAVGKFAAQSLLASDESIGRLRGAVHTYRGAPLIVTYHPAYLLRSPQMTRVAWQDFQLLRKVLHEQARG